MSTAAHRLAPPAPRNLSSRGMSARACSAEIGVAIDRGRSLPAPQRDGELAAGRPRIRFLEYALSTKEA